MLLDKDHFFCRNGSCLKLWKLLLAEAGKKWFRMVKYGSKFFTHKSDKARIGQQTTFVGIGIQQQTGVIRYDIEREKYTGVLADFLFIGIIVNVIGDVGFFCKNRF